MKFMYKDKQAKKLIKIKESKTENNHLFKLKKKEAFYVLISFKYRIHQTV